MGIIINTLHLAMVTVTFTYDTKDFAKKLSITIQSYSYSHVSMIFIIQIYLEKKFRDKKEVVSER